jgi:hypothetical protein
MTASARPAYPGADAPPPWDARPRSTAYFTLTKPIRLPRTA